MPSHLGRTSVFMTFRNCLLAPAKACNPSLRLQPCLGDRFRAAVTASEALACHLTLDGPLFLRRSETAFWHPQRLVTPRCASSRASETVSEPQRLLQKPSHAISPWTYLLPSRSDCFRSPRMPSHLGRTSVFMTFRNCLLAPAKACNPSLRLQPCLGDRFRAAVTASEALACHLTLDGPLFL